VRAAQTRQRSQLARNASLASTSVEAVPLVRSPERGSTYSVIDQNPRLVGARGGVPLVDAADRFAIVEHLPVIQLSRASSLASVVQAATARARPTRPHACEFRGYHPPPHRISDTIGTAGGAVDAIGDRSPASRYCAARAIMCSHCAKRGHVRQNNQFNVEDLFDTGGKPVFTAICCVRTSSQGPT
jgi:hypothetical protein